VLPYLISIPLGTGTLILSLALERERLSYDSGNLTFKV
jgi:hypothetical protein